MEMTLEDKILTSFDRQPPPIVIGSSSEMAQYEKEEIQQFVGKCWWDITLADVEKSGDAIYLFSDQAFQYFLPGFLIAGVRSCNRSSQAFDSIIMELDRSPKPEYWDDFFKGRWTYFTTQELEVIQEWVLWCFRARHLPTRYRV